MTSGHPSRGNASLDSGASVIASLWQMLRPFFARPAKLARPVGVVGPPGDLVVDPLDQRRIPAALGVRVQIVVDHRHHAKAVFKLERQRRIVQVAANHEHDILARRQGVVILPIPAQPRPGADAQQLQLPAQVEAGLVNRPADAPAAYVGVDHDVGAVQRATMHGVMVAEVAAIGERVPVARDFVLVPADDQARGVADDVAGAIVDRDELADELFDILDALGKGYSFTEIIWETSERQWRPARLEWRDPRWFRFERRDLATPVLLDEGGREIPLPPFKFIVARMKAKSGLVLRSGLARVAAWGWMFKAYTQRDWAIFAQTYGQPLRVGKFGPNATAEDKATLFRAVANIAGDCAAIVPQGMEIDFIESKNVGPGSDLYEKRADWLDRQISKAVLGQTTTTDAVSGGHAVSQEHRLVQEDIERADARVLQGILNRDLIRPWVDLEFGPQKRYPRLRIARPEAEDLKQLAESLNILVPLGVRVSMSDIRDRFGLADPGPEDEILRPMAPSSPPAAPAPGAPGPEGVMKARSAEIQGGQADPGIEAAQAESGAPEAVLAGLSPEALLADRLAVEAQPAMGEMMAAIEAMVEAAGDMDELRDATNKAAQSFDAFFDSVGASEIELAMDAVRRRDRVREIVPLRDG